MSEPVLSTRGLRRSFTQGDVTIEVLRGVDLDVQPGEIVALARALGIRANRRCCRRSGCSKAASKGRSGSPAREAAELDDEGRTELRRDALGFVYQFHHLLPDFNARENVILPQLDPRAPTGGRARPGGSSC